ncbi:MAG TPA: DUF493 family protein [Salinimicrobium sp.]|nr:DUF493 family protein [Salinimicrobium sp.]
MSNTPNPEEFYAKLKIQLEETSSWPTTYLFKFIVPSEESKILQIENTFNNMGAVITKKLSGKGNYTSVSINVIMEGPDAVIAKYREIGDSVEGVISL